MGVSDPGALAPMAAGAPQSVFDPGPSFHEQPSEAPTAGELPGWLQNFAGVVAEPDLPAPTPAPTALADAAELPNWLTEPRTGAPAAHEPARASWNGAETKLEPQDDAFISEDDLPDWLRAISLDPVSEEHDPAPAPMGATAGPATAAPRAPAVASAWVTPRQSVALATGESLFADIAGEEPRQASATSEPSAAPAVALTSAPADATVAADAVAAPSSAAPPFARRYLLYLVVAMALLALIFLVK